MTAPEDAARSTGDGCSVAGCWRSLGTAGADRGAGAAATAARRRPSRRCSSSASPSPRALVGGRWPAVARVRARHAVAQLLLHRPACTRSPSPAASTCSRWCVFVVMSLAVASVVDSAARRRHQADRRPGRGEHAGDAQPDRPGRRVRRTPAARAGPRDLRGRVRRAGADATARCRPATRWPRPRAQSLLVLHGGVARARATSASSPPSPGHLGVLREREELARQTAAARELEAGNRTRTALLAAVSHDLRTPLAGIRAAAETLRRTTSGWPPRTGPTLLRAIEESTGRLTAIVSDLLDMSRLQTGAVQPVLARRAARRGGPGGAGRAGRRRAGARRRPAAGGVVPTPACSSGCWPTCSATRCGTPTAPWRSPAAPSATGCGCASPTTAGACRREQRHRMFEPFQRLGDSAAGDGVGLGLAVARGLAEAQGGSLVADGDPRRRADHGRRAGGGRMRILLVEDDPTLRRTLAIGLRAEGHEVLTAGGRPDRAGRGPRGRPRS